MKRYMIWITMILNIGVIQGCVSLADNTIYPCSIGCGNEGITPPKGYVYYQNRLMKLSEFNRITGQNLVLQ